MYGDALASWLKEARMTGAEFARRLSTGGRTITAARVSQWCAGDEPSAYWAARIEAVKADVYREDMQRLASESCAVPTIGNYLTGQGC